MRSFLRIPLIVLLGIVACTGRVQAQEITTSSGKGEELVFLLVDKTKLKADLLTWPEDGKDSERLISFRIAIGKGGNGDKQKSGDNKTPEGIYFAKSLLSKGLPAKYGPMAIPIDFPNPLDRYFGKTGYGIWLHGVEQDNRIDAANVTEGCVAFYNADIRSLSQWLMPSQSVIVIAKDASQVNRTEDVQSVRSSVVEWADAWNQRDLDRYITLYMPQFQSMDKQSLKKYYNYKKRVFASYTEMSVRMKNIRVFTHDRYAVALMDQEFDGDKRYKAYGRKVLYWQRTADGGWKIFHEEFDKSKVRFTDLAREKIAQIIRNSPSTKFLQDSRESKL